MIIFIYSCHNELSRSTGRWIAAMLIIDSSLITFLREMYMKMMVSASRMWLFELNIFGFWTVDQAQHHRSADVCLFWDVFCTCWLFKNIICRWIDRKQAEILVSFSPVVFIWFAEYTKGADWSMICEDIVEKHPSLFALSINPSVSHFYQEKKIKNSQPSVPADPPHHYFQRVSYTEHCPPLGTRSGKRAV